MPRGTMLGVTHRECVPGAGHEFGVDGGNARNRPRLHNPRVVDLALLPEQEQYRDGERLQLRVGQRLGPQQAGAVIELTVRDDAHHPLVLERGEPELAGRDVARPLRQVQTRASPSNPTA